MRIWLTAMVCFSLCSSDHLCWRHWTKHRYFWLLHLRRLWPGWEFLLRPARRCLRIQHCHSFPVSFQLVEYNLERLQFFISIIILLSYKKIILIQRKGTARFFKHLTHSFKVILFSISFLVKGEVGYLCTKTFYRAKKSHLLAKESLLCWVHINVNSSGPFVWQIFEVPTFCSSRPVVNVDAKLSFSSEVKQIALDDLKCRLRDGTKVSCVDVTACFEYSGIGIERRLGETFRGA